MGLLTKQQEFTLKVVYPEIYFDEDIYGKKIKGNWYDDRANWIRVSCNFKLSEDFMREFRHFLDMNCLLYWQHLSEDFIRDFAGSLNCNELPVYQKHISHELIEWLIEKKYASPNLKRW